MLEDYKTERKIIFNFKLWCVLSALIIICTVICFAIWL